MAKTRSSKKFAALASAFVHWSGRPIIFFLALGMVAVWAVTGPLFAFSETWQLVINTGTTIITFLMVFLIQNAQNRDSAALQTKLDEIILVLRHAHNDVIGLEHRSDEEIADAQKKLERKAGRTD
jgi:low affinity Fe/Cu permease